MPLMHFIVGPPSAKPATKTGRFTVSREYVKSQAGEAVALFLAPASGVFNAVTGERMRFGSRRRDPDKKRA